MIYIKKLGNLNKNSEHLMLIKIGFGQFGSVYLVKNKNDSHFYALKVIQKPQVI